MEIFGYEVISATPLINSLAKLCLSLRFVNDRSRRKSLMGRTTGIFEVRMYLIFVACAIGVFGSLELAKRGKIKQSICYKTMAGSAKSLMSRETNGCAPLQMGFRY